MGIVGRTGAGKSTIASALTRIVEVVSGSIEIDGVNIADIDLNSLRDKITVIPQDPTLFTGTLRYNIDPLNLETDETIEALIHKAGLYEVTTKNAKTKGKGKKAEKNDDGKSEDK